MKRRIYGVTLQELVELKNAYIEASLKEKDKNIKSYYRTRINKIQGSIKHREFDKEPQMETEPIKSRRGFAGMSLEKRKAIASMGGKAAHKKGVAHTWNSETAAKAGKKGGQISRGGRGKLTN